MPLTRKWSAFQPALTVASTELNGLAAGSLVLAAASFNNVQGQAALDGYTRAFIQMNLAATTAAHAANTSLDLWFLKTVNKVEDGGPSVPPTRNPDVSWGVTANSLPQSEVLDVEIPPGVSWLLFRNTQGSGSQALGATGNFVCVGAYTDQGVS